MLLVVKFVIFLNVLQLFSHNTFMLTFIKIVKNGKKTYAKL